MSFGKDIFDLTKYNKIQLTDTTVIKAGNSGGYILPYWKIECIDKKNSSKLTNFIKSTKSKSPSSKSGATSLPPIGSAFMYIETSSNNHGNNVFVSFERTDKIQITNISFYYNRLSILTDDNLKNMGRFRVQLLLGDNTSSTQNTIAKNTQYNATSSDWTVLKLGFTV